MSMIIEVILSTTPLSTYISVNIIHIKNYSSIAM